MNFADPIVSVRWREVAVPFRAAVTNSQATYRVRESVLLEISSESGAIGIGEAALPAGSTLREHGAAIDARINTIAAPLLGRPAGDCWRGFDFELQEDEFAGWPAALLCGAETALADLAARALETPLFRWLAREAGITSPATPRTVSANGLVDLVEPDGAASTARVLAADGFRTLKVKVGGDVAVSLATIAAVREAAGPEVELRCDANRSWTFEAARAFLEGCEPYSVALCEEPMADPGEDFANLAALQRETRIVVGVDESARAPAALGRAVSAGIRLLVVKPMASGLRTSLDLLERAHAAGMQAIVTTTFDLAPGTVLAMHLAGLASPGVACGLATIDLVVEPLGSGVPPVQRGELVLQDTPGLGVELEHAAIERFATGPWRELGA